MLQQWAIFSSQRKYSAFVPLKHTIFNSYTLFSEFFGEKNLQKENKESYLVKRKKMETKKG